MNRVVLAIVAVAVATLTVACSSTSTSGSSCTVDGTYAVTEAQDPKIASTCAGQDPTGQDTFTFATQNDGTVSFTFGGLTGSCNGNRLNGCTLTLNCTVGLKAGGTGTLQSTFTFDAHGFTGTETLTENPTTGSTCALNATATGTRK